MMSDGLSIGHTGYRRLRGVNGAQRHWRFTDAQMVIKDQVDGSGWHKITRRLFTQLPVQSENGRVIIRGQQAAYHLTSDGPLQIESTKIWPAYGVEAPATCIDISVTVRLPWSGDI